MTVKVEDKKKNQKYFRERIDLLFDIPTPDWGTTSEGNIAILNFKDIRRNHTNIDEDKPQCVWNYLSISYLRLYNSACA